MIDGTIQGEYYAQNKAAQSYYRERRLNTGKLVAVGIVDNRVARLLPCAVIGGAGYNAGKKKQYSYANREPRNGLLSVFDKQHTHDDCADCAEQ